MEAEAESLLDKLYKSWVPLEDSRFSYYSTRRFGHLLKLAIIFAAARYSTKITKLDVTYCNTVLTLTENFMPRALGEFGKARNSATANKVLEYLLSNDDKPRTISDIFKSVSSDIEKIQDLSVILMNLGKAGKIQQAGSGFLPRRSTVIGENTDFVDWSLLTAEELANG
jgi:hypothetical protein